MHALIGMIALAAATLSGAAPGQAQTYPSRPINMIVPFPPGGNTDIMARALQNEISRTLGPDRTAACAEAALWHR
jgi:tripartite-type tricarboxylate transporter receptor subunit TctC